MKLKITTLILAAFVTFNISAQEIYEKSITMSQGVNNGFVMVFPDAERKNVQKLWKNYLKEFSKKVKDKKGEYYTEEASVAIIAGGNPLTIYAEFDEGRDQTSMNTWVDLNGEWLNSEIHVEEHTGLEQFLTDFFYVVRKDVFQRLLKDEEDKLKDINKSLKKLQNKNEDLHDDIRKAEDKIRKAEEDIQRNLTEQEKVEADIEAQKEVIRKVIEKLNKVGL